MSFWAYVLRCADGSYYTGHTDELERRIAQHQSGELKGYTLTRRPVTLMWSQEFATRDEALRAEQQIKGWSRPKKEALIRGDWDGVHLLAMRTPVLRDAASTSSAAPQDERNDQISVRAEEALSEAEVPSRSTSSPIIVLVRPQLGQNIGKAARAMLNFGLTEMRLVSPRDGWPNPDAGPAASGADLVLENAKVFETTAEAIADCSTVYASTVRKRELATPVLGPEDMARQMTTLPGRSAILFGPERSGLATEDVVLANAIVTVPINPEFGSLNLAQAVILLAYEWSRSHALGQPTLKEVEPPAPHAELDGLVAQLETALDHAGYFYPPERTAATKATLRTLLTKPQWSSRELRAMRGIVRALSSERKRKS